MFVGEGRPKGRKRSALLAGSSCLELGYGRFLQPDPLGYGDGMNLYNYVGGDPVNRTDPMGLTAADITVTASYRFLPTLPLGDLSFTLPFMQPLDLSSALTPQPSQNRKKPQFGEGEDVVVTANCNATCRANLREQERIKWVLMDGRFRLNPYYEDPTPWLNLQNAIIVPPLIGAAAAILPASGPAGLLFGRLRYRNGVPSLFNSGNFRTGWSWNSRGWAGSRNYFGVHGGKPGTPGHWHVTPVPGPRGPLW